MSIKHFFELIKLFNFDIFIKNKMFVYENRKNPLLSGTNILMGYRPVSVKS